MAKQIHKGRRKALTVVARKAKAGRSACVMKPEYLAEIDRFRLMDDDFMSKCLEHAPECIELILRIILGKKGPEGRQVADGVSNQEPSGARCPFRRVRA